MILANGLLACQAAGANGDGLAFPPPENGTSYRMSEVCQHIESAGYDERGTVEYTIMPDDVQPLIENIPSLARKPVEDYFADGVAVSVEIDGLRTALNR